MANIRDFYMRTEEDPRFRPDQLEVYDSVESCINQVMMTLLTKKGEVLGEPSFGLQVEEFLFEFELDPSSLSDDAYSQVDTFVIEAKRRNVKIKPSFTTDNKGRKIFALQISIDGRSNPYAILYG